MASQSHAYIMKNPRVGCGIPLGVKPHPDLDPDERSVNEKGVVVETSTHSINRRCGGSGHGDRTVSSRYPYGQFFLHAHADLSLHLIGRYMHNLTKEGADERL